MQVQARALHGKDKKFEATTIERRELDDNDVHIDIQFCGVCHSDVHTGRSEWGETSYPIVTGHEIAGKVAEVGSKVTKYKKGDRVGVGCMVSSCKECESCKKSEEQYCLKGFTGTYGATDKYGEMTQGGYSDSIVVDQDFVLKIPDAIELQDAAPLLCAGITTYSPLRHWNAGEGTKVAVVGLGGLGHMAVQIAHAMGAEVSVLSRTLDKKDDGLSLGADHYYATKDEETFKRLNGSFDLIINTVSAHIDLNAHLALLKPEGTMVNVGAPAEPLSVNVFSLVRGRRSFAGSLIGGIKETQELLEFCAEKNIRPKIEMIRADEIDEAWERMLKSDVRYRFVIDCSTL